MVMREVLPGLSKAVLLIQDALVNSMTGDVTGSINTGGVSWIMSGINTIGTFNRFIYYMTGDLVGTSKGCIAGRSITAGNGKILLINCIVAMNGNASNTVNGTNSNPSNSTFGVKYDASFGLIFSSSSSSSTSESLTGFSTLSVFSELPYVPFEGVDSRSAAYSWDFVFGNLSGNPSYSTHSHASIGSADLKSPFTVEFDSAGTEYVSFFDHSARAVLWMIVAEKFCFRMQQL